MQSASRTLLQSPPELWEMIDQPERMQGLMSSLIGHAAEIEVAEREPEQRLVWESRSAPDEGRIEVEIAEKGWGTHVELTASCEREENEGHLLEGWLDAVMEELSTPEKRPFKGIV
jgi:hypothetical protein